MISKGRTYHCTPSCYNFAFATVLHMQAFDIKWVMHVHFATKTPIQRVLITSSPTSPLLIISGVLETTHKDTAFIDKWLHTEGAFRSTRCIAKSRSRLPSHKPTLLLQRITTNLMKHNSNWPKQLSNVATDGRNIDEEFPEVTNPASYFQLNEMETLMHYNPSYF